MGLEEQAIAAAETAAAATTRAAQAAKSAAAQAPVAPSAYLEEELRARDALNAWFAGLGVIPDDVAHAIRIWADVKSVSNKDGDFRGSSVEIRLTWTIDGNKFSAVHIEPKKYQDRMPGLWVAIDIDIGSGFMPSWGSDRQSMPANTLEEIGAALLEKSCRLAVKGWVIAHPPIIHTYLKHEAEHGLRCKTCGKHTSTKLTLMRRSVPVGHTLIPWGETAASFEGCRTCQTGIFATRGD